MKAPLQRACMFGSLCLAVLGAGCKRPQVAAGTSGVQEGPLPGDAYQYPGSRLQSVQLLPSDERGEVLLSLAFATDDSQATVVEHYRALLRSYGRVVVHRAKTDLAPGADVVTVADASFRGHVVIVRADKHDMDPSDGYSRSRRHGDEETKIRWVLYMKVPKAP